MDGFIGMPDDYMVRYWGKRIETESGTGVIGRRHELGFCDMIDGDESNDESNKTSPSRRALNFTCRSTASKN